MTTWKRISVPVHRRLAGTTTFRPPIDVGGGEDAPRTESAHIYKVGQRLKMVQGPRYFPRGATSCQVVGLVPIEGGQIRYRVRGDTESFERIVVQADLDEIDNDP